MQRNQHGSNIVTSRCTCQPPCNARAGWFGLLWLSVRCAGIVADQQLAKYLDSRGNGAGGAGNLLSRLAAAGARAVAGGSRVVSFRESWSMQVHTCQDPDALQQLAAGRPLLQQLGAPEQGRQQPQKQPQPADNAQQPQRATQQLQQASAQLRRDTYTWLVSVVCEVQPPAEPPHPEATAMLMHAPEPTVSLAAVAVCTGLSSSTASMAVGNSNSSGSTYEAPGPTDAYISSSSGSRVGAGSLGLARQRSTRSDILPAGGAFSLAAVPGPAAGLLGQQQFLVNLQGPGTAALHAAQAARGGDQGSGQQLSPVMRAALAGLVSAWQEVLASLRGAGQQLYVLLPDLLTAVQQGNEEASFIFRQVGVVGK